MSGLKARAPYAPLEAKASISKIIGREVLDTRGESSPSFAIAHFNLGLALSRLGERDRARTAFDTALRFQPGMVNAHPTSLFCIRITVAIPKPRAFIGRKYKKSGAVEMQNLRRDDRVDRIFDLPDIPLRRNGIRFSCVSDPILRRQLSAPERISFGFRPSSIGHFAHDAMLAAGGIAVSTDGERLADIDNPKGYYEWEAIKKIAAQPELLDADDLDARAIKCISMLPPKMPLNATTR